MTVRLELKPEIEAALNAQADAKGVPLDAYLQAAIEALAGAAAAVTLDQNEIQARTAALDRLAEMGKNLPHVPSAAFSRDSIYQDHS